MMMPILKHETLNATLTGVDSGSSTTQYRGIPYGIVEERFAEPKALDDLQCSTIDCQKWGPRCPQNRYDVGQLLRAPEGDIFFSESEDEFKCLNLDVTIPANAKQSDRLPVMIWIHGGSQIISYGNGASKVGDTVKIVAESVEHGTPVIIVSVQYRLNIFHVGDGRGTKNLGFKDQQLAVQWVHKHIKGFGGDPTNMTIAGESAGAAFVHGLIVSGVKARRAIVMSGSFYMSSPRPEVDARSFPIDPVLKKVQEKGYSSLKDAPVSILLQAQAEVPVPSVFMQQDDCFSDWQTRTGEIDELLIGECEFESVLWRNGVEAMTAKQIGDCFDKAGDSSKELKELYHINTTRETQSKHGALDLINDVLWVLPTLTISTAFRGAGKKVYRYLFDQANPWQASSRAHHAVDLLYLFGGFDMSMNPSADALGREMRKRFISFIYGLTPWSEERPFAFGPVGVCSEVDESSVAARRRTRQIGRLQKMDSSNIKAVVGGLVAGRINLHN